MAKDKFFEENNEEWWNTGEFSDGETAKENESVDEQLVFKDSNGTLLQAGDTVTIIKGLKVKGGKDIKQGTTVKNIRLTDDSAYVEGKVDGSVIVIKTEFVKKN
jgi:protein PhnA